MACSKYCRGMPVRSDETLSARDHAVTIASAPRGFAAAEAVKF